MVNRKTDNKENIDRATALLSLAASEEKVLTSCLTPQEMAELIDEQSGQDTLLKFQNHLSSCEDCYRQWLFLKKMKAPENKRGWIYKFSSTPKGKITGTALAIAASVAVFLNIPEHQETLLEESFQIQETTPRKISPASLQHLEKKAKTPDILFSPVADSALDESQAIEKENVHQERTAGSTEGYLPPSMGAGKNAMVAGNIAPPAPPSDKRAELDRWIAELKKHCAPDAQTLSSLHSIKLQGEDILENQSQGLSSEKRKLILPLLQLLAPVIDEQSAITQCQLIRSKLAEDEESK